MFLCHRLGIVIAALGTATMAHIGCQPRPAVPSHQPPPRAGTPSADALSSPTNQKARFLNALRELATGFGTGIKGAQAEKLFDISLEKTTGPYWTGRSRSLPVAMVLGRRSENAAAFELELVTDLALAVTLADLEGVFGPGRVISSSKTSHVRFPTRRPEAGLWAEVLGPPGREALLLRLVFRAS